MKYVDLSRDLNENTQVYPGDPAPAIRAFATVEQDGFNARSVRMGTHTGTHIDAPYHFFEDGKTLDDFPVESFCGRGRVIDITGKEEESAITAEELKEYEGCLHGLEIVILRTGWENYYRTEKYFKQPYLKEDAAEVLLKSGVRIVGIDASSVDGVYGNSVGEKAHRVLLGNGRMIVENLCSLEELPENQDIWFSFFPLKLSKADGAPVRAVAMIEDMNSGRCAI